MLSLPNFKQKQIIFAFVSRDEKLSFSNDNIIIKSNDGTIKYQSTCYRLFAVFIVGHVSITSGLLRNSEKFHFSIVLMTHSLRPYSTLNAYIKGNTLLISKQYKYQGLHIAIHLVKNKIENQILTLKNIKYKSDILKKKIQKIEKLKKKLNVPHIKSETILATEGICSKIYFKELFKDMDWIGRKPRTKINPINTLMDLGYTLLFHLVEGILNCYGFDLYKGVYHKDFFQRKSLVCDLVEPFRVIIDKKIKKAYSLKQIKETDFYQGQNKYILFHKKAEPYVKIFMEDLLKYKTDIFLYIQKYYRCFSREKSMEHYPNFYITNSSI